MVPTTPSPDPPTGSNFFLAAWGLSFGLWNLWLQHVRSINSSLAREHSLVPGPLHCEHGVLATRPPGKSPSTWLFKATVAFQHIGVNLLNQFLIITSNTTRDVFIHNYFSAFSSCFLRIRLFGVGSQDQKITCIFKFPDRHGQEGSLLNSLKVMYTLTH